MALRPTDEQQNAIDLFRSGGPLTIEAVAGSGKALRNDQRVLTASGWKRIDEITTSDKVYGSDGATHAVTGVFPQGIREMYRVTFRDGASVICDGDHFWTVENTRDRGLPGFVPRVMTTKEIIRHGVKSPKGRRKWFLPSLEAIQYPEADLPIHPYVLGAILGDGSVNGSVTFTTNDPPMLDRIGKLVEHMGVVMRPMSNKPGDMGYRFAGRQKKAGHKGFWNPITDALNKLGLRYPNPKRFSSRNKFVPESYLRASIEQRLELLRGLMDTDGTRVGPNSFEFYSMSPGLISAVVELVQSLGGVARVATKLGAKIGDVQYEESLRVYGQLPSSICPFWLPRKADGWGERSRFDLPWRCIESIEPVESAGATCISVDADDHLFVTEGYVLTHNSSTLHMIARDDAARGRRGLYLAFNRAIREEADRKFAGTGVFARTMHALAYKDFGAPYAHRLQKQPPMQWSVKADILGIRDKISLMGTGAAVGALSRQKLTGMATATVKAFSASTADQITTDLVTLPLDVAGIREEEEQRLREDVVRFAERYWADLTSRDGKLRFEHDHYLKMWQLSRPHLPYDYIMLDEGQDADDLMISVLNQQKHAQMIVVGDRNQAIYGWRGARDAMDAFGGVRAPLQQSFRFGRAIADYANEWLELLGSDLRIVGNPALEKSTVGVAPKRMPDAVLMRTNYGSVSEIVAAQGKGHTVGIAGDRKAAEIRALAKAALDLTERGATSHPELGEFNTWSDVIEYSKSEDGGDLAPLVDVVEKVGAIEVMNAIDSCIPTENARVTISTAHVSKGLEWMHVRIGDDFREPKTKNGIPEPMLAEEARLAYVAATRAQRWLDPSGLDWLDEYVSKGGYVAEESNDAVHEESDPVIAGQK